MIPIANDGLRLTTQEFERLSMLVADLRHREAVPFVQILQAVYLRAQKEAARNGSTDATAADQPTAGE